MNTLTSFLILIAVWSTTPLAIKLSSDGIDPYTGLFSRMLLATIIGHLVLRLAGIKISWSRTAISYYLVTNLGFTVGITLVYLASTQISSGLISLVFGCSPLICRLCGQKILGEAPLTATQWIGLITAFSGLSAVLLQRYNGGQSTLLGTMMLLSAVSCFSLSSVLLKKINFHHNPLSSCVGSLTLSVLPLGALWLMMGNPIDSLDISLSSGWAATLYLAIFGSLISQAAYFKALRLMSPTTVALVTLVTPIIALVLSQTIEGARFSITVFLGATITLIGLSIFLAACREKPAN